MWRCFSSSFVCTLTGLQLAFLTKHIIDLHPFLPSPLSLRPNALPLPIHICSSTLWEGKKGREKGSQLILEIANFAIKMLFSALETTALDKMIHFEAQTERQCHNLHKHCVFVGAISRATRGSCLCAAKCGTIICPGN